MEFTLTITLGNDAMETAADVAEALKGVVSRLARIGEQNFEDLDPSDCGGKIFDANGNSVGKWEV